MSRLIVILGDQLSHQNPALQQAAPDDVILMAELRTEARYVPHHPQKIALIFSAMRHFAKELRTAGRTVAYVKYDDPDNQGSFAGEIEKHAMAYSATEVIVTEPSEWRVIDELHGLTLPLRMVENTLFLASREMFETWAQGRKALRMEYFYRDMRRLTGLLMDGKDPVGGAWNFDAENRKAPPKSITHSGPISFEADAVTQEVLQLVERDFSGHFGDLSKFSYGVTRDQALAALDHFVEHALPSFGDFQDAMLAGEPFLYHAVISPYLNIGLLHPLEVCRAAERAYYDGLAPLNAVEGFIRQIIGWREYVRGIYFLKGREYMSGNALGATRALPDLYWGQPTLMNCLSHSVAQTQEHAYAHHIQRLMVLGNFALLTGVAPQQIHEWFLAVYIDAYEWVEAPNVIGMSQFADDGVIASKPYVSSGAYINRMSDYCKGCSYKVAQKTGPKACPFNVLYWDFLLRHEQKFSSNPRMGQMYRTWAKMDEDRRATVLEDAQRFLTRLDQGELV